MMEINKKRFLEQIGWPEEKEIGDLTWKNNGWTIVIQKNRNIINLKIKQTIGSEIIDLLDGAWETREEQIKTIKFLFIGADFSDKALQQQLLLIDAQAKSAKINIKNLITDNRLKI